MTLAILCSGQGGQHAGMFALTGSSQAAEGLFSQAATLLREDPRTWVTSAGEKALYANRSAQLLCTLQALCAAALPEDVFPRERCIAGYSVGEVAAWSLAGLINPKDALDLTAARADTMDAARHDEQAMLFVRGLSWEAYVLAGTVSAVQAIAADAQRVGRSRVVPVAVEVASHTPFLAEATAKFRERLSRLHVAPTPRPGTRLLSSIDGTPALTTLQSIDKLAMQISQTVQWATCLEACVEAGAVAFLELGPGRDGCCICVSRHSCTKYR
jgi:[acyl-carrier-protein] S-malonyltransferase